jgi:hypothetical protein
VLFPLPLEAEVMLIQLVLLTAVHVQPVPAVTLTLPLPPEDETELVVGKMVFVQFADCVTVNVCPAMVRVPVRELPVFAATE